MSYIEKLARVSLIHSTVAPLLILILLTLLTLYRDVSELIFYKSPFLKQIRPNDLLFIVAHIHEIVMKTKKSVLGKKTYTLEYNTHIIMKQYNETGLD